MQKVIPEILEAHILPFNWDVRMVWALETKLIQAPTSEFIYLLELPLWSSVPNQGMLFDTCPMDVIRNPDLSAYQQQRLQHVSLQHPIDVLVFKERRWILDGIHRIAKHFMQGSQTLPVRVHDESVIPAIKFPVAATRLVRDGEVPSIR